jgi:hypothetical protein
MLRSGQRGGPVIFNHGEDLSDIWSHERLTRRFFLPEIRRYDMDCKCSFCKAAFWKPSYDSSDATRCRRCTMFLNMEAAWRSRMSMIVPDPSQNKRSAFFGA